MNPLQALHEATIAKDRAMSTDTAQDRIEGYADGLSQKWQQRRSAAYNAANWDAWQESARLSGAMPPATVTGWQRVINWLRACLSSAA